VRNVCVHLIYAAPDRSDGTFRFHCVGVHDLLTCSTEDLAVHIRCPACLPSHGYTKTTTTILPTPVPILADLPFLTTHLEKKVHHVGFWQGHCHLYTNIPRLKKKIPGKKKFTRFVGFSSADYDLLIHVPEKKTVAVLGLLPF